MEPIEATLFVNTNNIVTDYKYLCKTALIKRNNVYMSDCYPYPKGCKY